MEKKEDIIFYEVGSDYNISSFFSTFTGRPTPLGWPGHQKQWGRDTQDINQRITDFEKPLNLSPSWSPKYQLYKLVKDAEMVKG